MGPVIALVLPHRVLHVIILDDKVVCASTTNYPLKCALAANGGTIVRNLGFPFSCLCSGTYKHAATLTFNDSQANMRFCLVGFGIHTPQSINIPD